MHRNVFLERHMLSTFVIYDVHSSSLPGTAGNHAKGVRNRGVPQSSVIRAEGVKQTKRPSTALHANDPTAVYAAVRTKVRKKMVEEKKRSD